MVPGLVFLLFPGGSAPDSWRYLIRGVRNNVCPLYWMSPGPGESAENLQEYGSLSLRFSCSSPVQATCSACSVWTIGESAADSWKFGSLSRGKMAKWR